MYQIYSVPTFTTHAKYLIAGTLQTSYLHFAWLHNHVFPFYIEPLKLIGEGKYNLNAIKVIKVTESFLGLDRSHKDCQSTEELDECTTRQFLDAYLDNCGCLPLSIWIKENVFIFKSYVSMLLCSIPTLLQVTLCSPEHLRCIQNTTATVDTSFCIRSCNGLMVTSYSKTELKGSMKKFSQKDVRAYRKYKRWFHQKNSNGIKGIKK